MSSSSSSSSSGSASTGTSAGAGGSGGAGSSAVVVVGGGGASGGPASAGGGGVAPRKKAKAPGPPHAASGELGLGELVAHMVDLFARPRYVWVVAGFTCCGPGGECSSDPLGSLEISGVFAEESTARTAFHKHVAGFWGHSGGTPSLEHCAMPAPDCNCAACKKVCEEQHEAAKRKSAERAQAELSEAERTQRDAPSAENEAAVRRRSESLEIVAGWEYDGDWLGPDFSELEASFFAGEPGAERFFHFHNVEAERTAACATSTTSPRATS